MGGRWHALRHALQRRRVFEPEHLETGNLRRCLNVWDLTGLGLGSTLGVGVYVLVGSVALRIAGPSILLSFVIAAVASLFAGLCYAEFGSRVPRAGSAYIYTYVTVGELVAFIIGWNMVLEGLFGTASVARGLSSYIDSMANGAMSAWFHSFAPVSSDGVFSSHFDFFAFFLVILLGVLLAFGARESSSVNNVLAIANLVVILFIVIAGAFAADSSNWSIPQSALPSNATVDYGVGGFFPYGVWGTLKGAAICFYGFVGFETVSASSEEVREPRRTIPVAILTVLVIVLVVYASIATVLTMMVPYYALDRVAAVATAFTYVDWEWARWIVSVGAVFGICASLFGAMFPLPRLMYAMASDGLLAHWLAHLSEARKSPRVATLVSACVIAVLAALVELEQLILMMCVGTLLSYTIVAICVIVLRYRSNRALLAPQYLKLVFGRGERSPSISSARIVHIALLLFVCVCAAVSLTAVHAARPLVPVAVLSAAALLLLLIITLQPQAKEVLGFKTPLVPVIPCLSIYINIQLMILVNVQTWIRIGIWLAIGIPIYILCVCCYKRSQNNLEENIKTFAHTDKNGKALQIVVESPTPPATMDRTSNYGGNYQQKEIELQIQTAVVTQTPMKTDEIIVQQAVIENNEEKEAKIIDLLDQVLQAEEDTYEEIVSLKEPTDEVIPVSEGSIPHRKSLSELSDAGSEASLGNQGLSKYDVIAQVHREDLPKVNEEEEKNGKEVDGEDYEQITTFNDSETNSHTDESGYSDTIDRSALNDSTEDTREEAPYIPPPPPLDESYFTRPYFNKYLPRGSLPTRTGESRYPDTKDKNALNSTPVTRAQSTYIPPPPPLDESYFANPYFKKSYSIPRGTVKLKPVEIEEEQNKPRTSVQSSNSQDDGTIVFGSNRQMSFMSKLNTIFQTKISTEGEEQQRRRSNSTGDMVDNDTFALNRERPSMLLDLQKEIIAVQQSAPILRPVKVEETKQEEPKEAEDLGMSRNDLRSKLEDMFASGGPKPFKPSRGDKSNAPTPEEPNQLDSSAESIVKLPKMDKNDTLSRQKNKFNEVLNSFRLSYNKDDVV